jgi:hypothetical protein
MNSTRTVKSRSRFHKLAKSVMSTPTPARLESLSRRLEHIKDTLEQVRDLATDPKEALEQVKYLVNSPVVGLLVCSSAARDDLKLITADINTTSASAGTLDNRSRSQAGSSSKTPKLLGLEDATSFKEFGTAFSDLFTKFQTKVDNRLDGLETKINNISLKLDGMLASNSWSGEPWPAACAG